MFDFFVLFFSEKRLFHRREDKRLLFLENASKFIISPVRLFFKKHDSNNKNSLRRKQKKKKNGPAGDDGTFRARIQRGFVF